MRKPILLGAALFGAGSLLVDGEARPAEASALVGLAALLLVLAPLAGAAWRGRALAATALALGTAGAEVESLQLRASGLRLSLEARAGAGEADVPLRVRGVVSGDPREADGRLGLSLEVSALEEGGAWRRTTGRLRLEIGGETPWPRLVDGDLVRLWAKLRVAEEPGRERLAARGYCKSARLVEVVAHGHGWLGRRLAGRVREWARTRLQRALPPGPERGLVLAMTLGDRSEIDDATAETFRASGTYHVLALSGAQVALVAALIAGLLRFGLAPPWLQALLTTVVIAAYALLVGGDVPVVRATLMAAAVLAGRALERDACAANLLGLAALLLLVAQPSALRDVGFQLSFAATLGILLLVPGLRQGLPRLPLHMDLAFAASLAAQLALAPILAATFHRLAPAALLLNVAAVPLSTAVLLTGVAVVAASALGPTVTTPFAWLAWAAARALRLSADLGPLAPWLDFRVAGPGAGLLLLHGCGLVLLGRGRRAAGASALAAFHAALVIGPGRPDADGRLHLLVVDVGQGESLVLRSPAGRTLIVDTGGSRTAGFDTGERNVAPELWRRAVTAVDALLITHGHPDHSAGAAYLLRAFRVREVWQGPAAPRDPAWRLLQSKLAGTAATRRALAAGAAIDWDGARLRVLGPRAPGRPPAAIRNEDSVVVEVEYGGVRFLLTGDVGGEAERALDVRRTQVLKLGHHGSRGSTSAAFLAAVRPRLALASAGARNPFGSPHPEVLARCLDEGALVLRTDRDGTVEVATDGERLWSRTTRDPVWRAHGRMALAGGVVR